MVQYIVGGCILVKEKIDMKLWIDDVRPAPEGYVWCKSVNEAKREIELAEHTEERLYKEALYCLDYMDKQGYHRKIEMCNERSLELIDIDHDAGEYASDGGDYIKLLDWLEETWRKYPIRIHSMNPVGVANMRAIIEKNGWKEVF